MAARLLAVMSVMLAGPLAGCGSANSQLLVSLTAGDQGSLKPGNPATFVVSVVNQGPGAAGGVSARVDLPPAFRYKATPSIDGFGLARTQPVDAAVNSPNPEWGLWSLSAPRVAADGTVQRAHVDITFTIDAEGRPGRYDITPRAASDSGGGEAVGNPTSISLDPAAKLSAIVFTSPSTVRAGDVVTYRLTVTNDGSGIAGGVGLLITLPPVLAYDGTDRIQGNSSRSNPIDPNRGAVLPFFGGFTVPARSDAGPGLLTIIFRAQCAAAAAPGRYPVAVQITDNQGDIVTVAGIQALLVVPA